MISDGQSEDDGDPGLAEFRGGPRGGLAPRGGGLEERLFKLGHRFDFFQAVRLLQRLRPGVSPVGHGARPRDEAVRFRSHQSLAFPASAVQEIRRVEPGEPPELSQNFLGLTGPSGTLPIHYSERVLQLRGPLGARVPLRDWLDLFNHRLTSFFYRTWEKYRAFPRMEREARAGGEPDPFTLALLSLMGLGPPSLRNRLDVPAATDPGTGAGIGDLTLVHHSGILVHRPPNVVSLELLLRGVFDVPVAVEQFRGQWLRLGEEQQTRIGWDDPSNAELGLSTVAGARAWDVQGKFQIRLGPLRLDQFLRFLPFEPPSPVSGGLTASLCRLVRLYVGPELEFEVRLVLHAGEVPACRLDSGDPVGSRLGWNTWLVDGRPARDSDDASFTDDFPRGY